MDDQVIASLKKWPNIPECYGWLSLDRRGEWRMLNEYAQVNHLPGDVIHHTGLKDFIVRNYAKDELGQFFFKMVLNVSIFHLPTLHGLFDSPPIQKSNGSLGQLLVIKLTLFDVS